MAQCSLDGIWCAFFNVLAFRKSFSLRVTKCIRSVLHVSLKAQCFVVEKTRWSLSICLVAGSDKCLYWPWQLSWSPFSLLLYWVEMSLLAGRIICVERTVLLLQKPLLCSAADADLSELPGPVKLDELDSTTQANSICAVRGLYWPFLKWTWLIICVHFNLSGPHIDFLHKQGAWMKKHRIAVDC